MTVLLSKISCYLCKGVCCILLAFQHESALAQRPPLQSADSSTGQHWNKSCILHRWGAVGCSLVATALILKNWNTALLKRLSLETWLERRERNWIDLLSGSKGNTTKKLQGDKTATNNRSKRWQGAKYLQKLYRYHCNIMAGLCNSAAAA